MPVVVEVADVPDHIGRRPGPPPHRPIGGHDVMGDTQDLAPGPVALDLILGIGDHMERALVTSEDVRDAPEGVVPGTGDDQREVVGIAGNHQLPVGHEQERQPLAVTGIGRGGVGDRQIEQFAAGPRPGQWSPPLGIIGRSAGAPLVGSDMMKRSAKADISSSVLSSSALMEAEMTSREAPAS